MKEACWEVKPADSVVLDLFFFFNTHLLFNNGPSWIDGVTFEVQRFYSFGCSSYFLSISFLPKSFNVLILMTYFLLYILIRLTVLSFCAALCFLLDSCVFRVVGSGTHMAQ